jgi:hypothetical protein
MFTETETMFTETETTSRHERLAMPWGIAEDAESIQIATGTGYRARRSGVASERSIFPNLVALP